MFLDGNHIQKLKVTGNKQQLTFTVVDMQLIR